jgi:acetate---CoA ligase (ADP-forming)
VFFSPRGVAVYGSLSAKDRRKSLAGGTLAAICGPVARGAAEATGDSSGSAVFPTFGGRYVVSVDPLQADEKMSVPVGVGSEGVAQEEVPAYASPLSVPRELASMVDLVVLVTPARFCAAALRDCAAAFPLRGAVVVSGGFEESAQPGRKVGRSRDLLEVADEYGFRIVGPNTVGTLDTHAQFSSMFLRKTATPGGVGFISQSGAVIGACVEVTSGSSHPFNFPSTSGNVGFSRMAALGNCADVSVVDALRNLGDDPNTRVIALYLEGFRENGGPEFIEVAREVAKRKPIVAVKTGKSAAGARAVSSHTGALAGDALRFSSVAAAAGVIEAPNLRTMLEMAHALDCRPRGFSGIDQRPRVAVATNAGGPAALLVDALDAAGSEVPEVSPALAQTVRDDSVHPMSQLANPLDLLAAGDPAAYRSALGHALQSDEFDAGVCVHVPTAISDVDGIAEAVASLEHDKPVAALLMSDRDWDDNAAKTFIAADIPVFQYPDGCAAAFSAWKQRANLLERTQRVDSLPALDETTASRARALLSAVRGEGGGWVLEKDARSLLELVDFPQPPGAVVDSADDAILFAQRVGYPVVMKRTDQVHKSEGGGVRIGLSSPEEVRAAFSRLSGFSQTVLIAEQVDTAIDAHEFIVGFVRDPLYGPLVSFGVGGTLVEAVQAVSFRTPPRNREDTLALLNEARISNALLSGFRGRPPVDTAVVAAAVEGVCQIIHALPEVMELDINPLIVARTQDGEWRAHATDVKFRVV